MAAILNFKFMTKMVKLKIACISLTVRDRAILVKFLAHRVSKQDTLPIFKKKFSSFQKWQPFSIFKFLTKMVKLKIACISYTVRDFGEIYCMYNFYS